MSLFRWEGYHSQSEWHHSVLGWCISGQEFSHHWRRSAGKKHRNGFWLKVSRWCISDGQGSCRAPVPICQWHCTHLGCTSTKSAGWGAKFLETSTPASSSHGQVRAPQLCFKARCSEATSREIYLSTNCKWNFSPQLEHVNEVPEVRNFRCSWFSSTLHNQQEQQTVQAHILNY